MKKTFILFIIMCLTTVGATAQGDAAGVKNSWADWAKWSLTLDGGINHFDGDIKQNYNSLVPTSLSKFSYGVGLEYTAAPAWSFGIDYMHLPLASKYNANNMVIADFSSKMHNVSFFTSFNILKTFLPRSNTKWGIWANAGLGYAWYKSTYYTERAGTGVKDGGKQLYEDFNDTINDGRTMFVPLSLLFEYNVSKSFAIGLRAQIRAFNTDYIERRRDAGVAKDYAELLTLQLRYKFNAKNKDHTRNYKEYVEENNIDELNRINDRIDGLGMSLEGLRNQLNNMDPRDPRYDGLERRVKELEERPIIEKELDEEAYVFFDFDKTDLDVEAYKAIEIAARKLKADPTLQVEVRGFADNMGTVEYNKGLSQRRADVVKNVLINTHGIDADRIVANGKGKLTDPPIAYRPNRRCDFYYFK